MDILTKKTFYSLSFFIFVIALATAAPSSAGVKEKAGNIKDIKGSANIVRNKKDLNARKNKPVFKTDTVKTHEKSRVKILFIDDSLVMIGENSSFTVSDHFNQSNRNTRSSAFNLINGTINVIVGKKGLEIHTPTAMTAARGTSYLLWTEKNKTGIAVTEGRVEVRNSNQTVRDKKLVPAGRMTFVAQGKPPATPVFTPPETVKVMYENTLDEKERWGPVILRAKGSGIPPPSARNPAQARLMALRAAKTEALRNLLEQAQGVTILSGSSIEDFTLKSDFIKSKVDAFIKGAWISEERKMSDGSYEVDMEIGLGIGFRRMFLEK